MVEVFNGAELWKKKLSFLTIPVSPEIVAMFFITNIFVFGFLVVLSTVSNIQYLFVFGQ